MKKIIILLVLCSGIFLSSCHHKKLADYQDQVIVSHYYLNDLDKQALGFKDNKTGQVEITEVTRAASRKYSDGDTVNEK